MLPLEFVSGAERDLQTHFDRLEEKKEGLGTEFVLSVDAYLSKLRQFPESAPNYVKSIRRQVMKGYPFGVFFDSTPTRLLVLAVLDLRQDPGRILERLGAD